MMKLIVIVSALIALTNASCPNKCSGHGACGANDVCECKQNWMGGDCSLRVCPYTRAWVDAAQANNDAHYYAECGNKGSCDRTTGICVCDAGYTGSGCRRQACPSDCSGHGTCEFIEEFAGSFTYTGWDQEKIMGCTCDPGFEGHDCSSKICPKGDDPVTSYDQNNMVQYLHYAPNAAHAGSIYLSYVDPYGATWTTEKIAAHATAATFCTSVQTALRNIPNLALKDITVAPTAVSAETTNLALDSTNLVWPVVRATDASTVGSYTRGTAVATSADASTAANANHLCLITFPAAAGTTGLQKIITCNVGAHGSNGHQPLVTDNSADVCNTGEYITGSGTTAVKLTELATCSNRGLCDGSTGDCQCFAGHRGLACETQEALV